MEDPEICKETIELLLKVKVEKLEPVETERSIDLALEQKSVRLDVYVKDENRVFNLEMQASDQKDLPHRSRYYQSCIDLDSIEKGSLYTELPESYVVFICLFDVFGRGLPCYRFENSCKEEQGLQLGDGTHKVFFNVDALERAQDENLKSFLKYVKGESSDCDLVQKMAERMKKIKMNPEWRKQCMTMLMQSKVDYARGQEETQEKIARAMLSEFDNATIARLTQLSLERIAELREEGGNET